MDNAVVALAREDRPPSVAPRRLDAAVKRTTMGAPTSDDFEVFRAASESLHPSRTYGVDCARLRRAYLGDLEGLARDALSRRYPKTWRRMPVVTQNIVRETAELDAQVYRSPPARTIGGDRDRARELADSVHLDEVMVEVERVSSLCGSVFIRHDEDGETLSVVWPHCSAVVPSETRPFDVDMARVVAVRIAGPGTDLPLADEVYEIWASTGAGWVGAQYTAKAERLTDLVGRSTLPIFALSLRPSSSPFASLDRDLLILQDAVNVMLSDHHYRYSLEAHRQIVVTGAQRPKQGADAMVLGPDAALWIPDSGSSVSSLPVNDSMSAFDAVSQSLILHARGRRQPIEAWHTKGGNPESGESRKIKNEWSDQKRAEHVRRFAALEKKILARLSGAAEADVEVKHTPAPTYENETSKLDRAIKMAGQGWWSPAQAAVYAGAYQTMEDAEAAGLSTTIEPKREPPPAFTAAQSPPVEDDDEDEQQDVADDDDQTK